MSLSRDIKQREFHSEYQKAMLNILFTHNFLVTHMSEVFKQFDITRQQYNVLRILRGQYPCPATINLIQDRMLDKMSDTSRIVKRLILKGLITKEESARDRRSADLTISPAGLRLLDSMEGAVSGIENQLQTLTPSEAAQLNILLDKLRGSLPDSEASENEPVELMNQAEKF